MYITENPIDLNEFLSHADEESTGAVVVFAGKTRNIHDGKSVSYLEYEAQINMAEQSIKNILTEARTRWGLTYAHAVHRIGRVEIGEISIAIVCSSGHRNEAYEANRYIIDTIKEESPIWKKEFYTDGSKNWK